MTIIKTKDELIKFCKENNIFYQKWRGEEQKITIKTKKYINWWYLPSRTTNVVFEKDSFTIEYDKVCLKNCLCVIQTPTALIALSAKDLWNDGQIKSCEF